MEIRELQRELEGARETIVRLNRRCQSAESVIAQHGETSYWARLRYEDGYKAGLDHSLEAKRWQYIAQKHGERAAQLRSALLRLWRMVGGLRNAEDLIEREPTFRN